MQFKIERAQTRLPANQQIKSRFVGQHLIKKTNNNKKGIGECEKKIYRTGAAKIRFSLQKKYLFVLGN